MDQVSVAPLLPIAVDIPTTIHSRVVASIWDDEVILPWAPSPSPSWLKISKEEEEVFHKVSKFSHTRRRRSEIPFQDCLTRARREVFKNTECAEI